MWWIVPPTLKSFLRVTFYELQAPLFSLHSHCKDLQLYWSLHNHSKRELIEEIRNLARLNAAYEVRLQENTGLQEEITRLEALFQLPSLPQYHTEITRVCFRDLNEWWQQIIVNKGRNAKIPVGAAVIYAGGIVGRVKEVHAYTSTIELLTSDHFRMASNFEGDPNPVVYRGISSNSFCSPKGSVGNIPSSVQIPTERSLRLVSSKWGGIFPPNLTIGYVKHLSPNGLFQEGVVQLDKRLLSLQEVAILIPLSPSDHDTT